MNHHHNPIIPILPPTTLTSKPIRQHGIHQLAMPLRIRLAPLRIIIQAIWPEMPPSTINLRALAIPTLQQLRRRRPIIRLAPVIKRPRLPDPQCMRNLMQRRALIHVRPVRPESDVAVEIPICRLHARDVLDGEGLVGALGDAVVPRCRERDGLFDARVGVLLVGRGVLGAPEGEGDAGGDEGGVIGRREGEEGETHRDGG